MTSTTTTTTTTSRVLIDVDNITLLTTLAGLAGINKSYMPVHLTNVPDSKPDLPGYIFVSTCGFSIYAKMMNAQKRDASRHIEGFGPLVVHSDAPDLFTVSRLLISFGLLYDAFLACSIDYVAIVVYGMKESFYFDFLGRALVSRDTSVCRRLALVWKITLMKSHSSQWQKDSDSCDMAEFVKCAVSWVRVVALFAIAWLSSTQRSCPSLTSQYTLTWCINWICACRERTPSHNIFSVSVLNYNNDNVNRFH